MMPTTRANLFLLTLAGLTGLASVPPAVAQTSHAWTNWTSATGGGADGAPGVVSGSLLMGSTTVGTSYEGPFFFTVLDAPGQPEWSTANFTGDVIRNRPPSTDLIGLQGGPGLGRVTFAQAIMNPVLSILSLGLRTNDGRFFPAEMVFGPDVQFEVLNSSASAYGFGGPLVKTGQTLSGRESSGSIRFIGTYASIEWTTPLQERIAPSLPVGGTWSVAIGAPCYGGYQVGPRALTVAASIPAGCSGDNIDIWRQEAALEVAGTYRNLATHHVLAPLTIAPFGSFSNGGTLIVPAGQTVTVNGAFRSFGTIIDLESGVLDFHQSFSKAQVGALSARGFSRVSVENARLELFGEATFEGASKLSTGALGFIDVSGALTFKKAATMDVAPFTIWTVKDFGSLSINDQVTARNRGKLEVQYGYLDINSRLVNEDRVLISEWTNTTGYAPGYMNIAGTFQNLASGSLTATSGFINIFGLLDNAGLVELRGGQHIVETGGLLSQRGTLRVSRTTFENQGTILQSAGAITILDSGGGFINAGRFENAGALVMPGKTLFQNEISGIFVNQAGASVILVERLGLLDDPATFQNTGLFANQGRLVVGGLFQNEGIFQQSGAGVIHLANGTFDARDFVLTGGSITGTGIWEGHMVVATGVVGVGNSPGRIDVTGDFRMTGGELKLEVARDGRSDELRVAGSVSNFGGNVSVSFLDGVAPDLDQTFDLITSGNGLNIGISQLVVGDSALGYSSSGGVLSLFVQPLRGAVQWGQIFSYWDSSLAGYVDSDLGRAGDLLGLYGSTLGIRRSGVVGWNDVNVWPSGRLFNSGDLEIRAALNLGGEFINRHRTLLGSAEVLRGGSFRNTGDLTLGGGDSREPVFFNRGSVHHAAGRWINVTDGSPPLIINESGALLRVSSQMSGAATVLNAGEFWVDRDGRVADLLSFTQSKGVTRVDGMLQAASLTISGGVLEGSGTVEGMLVMQTGFDIDGVFQRTLVRGGTQERPGRLSFAGMVDFLEAGEGVTLEFLVASPTEFSSMHFDNVAFGYGTSIRVVLTGGFQPQAELSLPIIVIDPAGSMGGLTNLYDNFGVFRRSAGGDIFWEGGQSLSYADGTFSAFLAPVPEPSTWALVLGGIAVVGWRALRQQRKAGREVS